jgi:hypothetical protein
MLVYKKGSYLFLIPLKIILFLLLEIPILYTFGGMMEKEKEIKIKEILKKYISSKINLKKLSEKMNLSENTLKTYSTKNKYISNKFIINFSKVMVKDKNITLENKNFLLKYASEIQVQKKKERKKENLNSIKLDKILMLLEEKVEKKKDNIYQKRDNILKFIDENKSDYLKYIELLKKIKKDLAELDVLSSFNLNLKDKSRNEINKLLDKIINEVKNIQSKITKDNIIMEVELIENK